MANPESSESPQVKLMYELDSGFTRRDLDIIAKQLHKDYRHITHPRSLGMPEQSREEWLKHFAWVMSLWTENVVSYQFPLQFTTIGWIDHLAVDHPFDHRSTGKGRCSRLYSRLIEATRIHWILYAHPQLTSRIKTSIGVDVNRESICIAQIVTDEDGSLKIKQLEDFTDSKSHLDFVQAVMAAQACKSQE
jgi:hypothetical protein